MTQTGRAPVLVVGAGPTGLAVAILLAGRGIRSVVLDRWPGAYDRPRAVHLDDEVARIVGQLGLAPEFAAISRPSRGLRLVTADGGVLAEFPRPDVLGRHGYPQAVMFDQPELEQLLRAEAVRRPEVTLRLGVEVTAVAQSDVGVRVDVTDRATGVDEVLEADVLLGCDGANSRVRESLGVRMRDLHFDQRWLVVDVATDLDLGLWDGVHQVCDARRPATYLRVGPRRHRWEFRLADDEGPEDFPDLVAIAPLLQPWLGSVPVGELQLVRSAVYTFRARLADRWRDRRVFLLGDAAHLTPPFIGQGIGAGLRDAANLAWKLAGALDGTLPDDVLDSYEAERKPHARSMIRLARLVGVVMTAGGGVGDATRRLVAPRLPSVPGLRRRALDSATPALGRSSMVRPSGLPPRLAGSLCPNVVLPGGDRFDEVVGRAFAVVTTRTPTPEQQREIEGRGVVLLRCDETSELGTWLRQGRARVAVVRPDRTVLRTARDLAVSIEGLPASRPARSSPLPR